MAGLEDVVGSVISRERHTAAQGASNDLKGAINKGGGGITAGKLVGVAVGAATGGVGFLFYKDIAKFVDDSVGGGSVDVGGAAQKVKDGASAALGSAGNVVGDGKRRVAAAMAEPAASAPANKQDPATFMGPPEPTVGQKVSRWFGEVFGGAKDKAKEATAVVTLAAAGAVAVAAPAVEEPPSTPAVASAVTPSGAVEPVNLPAAPSAVQPVVAGGHQIVAAGINPTEDFTAAAAPAAKAKPIIALDRAGMDKAQAEGITAFSIEGHDRYKQAVDALSKGGKLDKFQENTLNELALKAGIERSDLDAQFKKPTAVAAAPAAPAPAP